MEFYELKYFYAAAEHENLQTASKTLRVSAPSISKAISRLEDELQSKLFLRKGRNIVISDQGRILREEVKKILGWEQSLKLRLKSEDAQLRLSIVGREMIMTEFALPFCDQIKKKYKNLSVELANIDEKDAFSQVNAGDSDIGFTSQKGTGHIKSKLLTKVKSVTVISKHHPLYRQASKILPIETVLEYGFVSPQNQMFGSMRPGQSTDGWRDDKFPRKVSFVADSFHLYRSIVTEGRAIAYVPSFLAEEWGCKVLKISGCPYDCIIPVYMNWHETKCPEWLGEFLKK
jgi:DNA-binding transcriptional LysR family regulator